MQLGLIGTHCVRLPRAGVMCSSPLGRARESRRHGFVLGYVVQGGRAAAPALCPAPCLQAERAGCYRASFQGQGDPVSQRERQDEGEIFKQKTMIFLSANHPSYKKYCPSEGKSKREVLTQISSLQKLFFFFSSLLGSRKLHLLM